MSSKPINRFSGSTIDEAIAVTPTDLDDIGLGLGHIVDDGRYGFGLEGEDLLDFVRRSLHVLIAHGAVVRHWGKPGDPHRDIPLHYGNDTPDEIVEGVIADWQAMGSPDLEWGDFWFARPGTE